MKIPCRPLPQFNDLFILLMSYPRDFLEGSCDMTHAKMASLTTKASLDIQDLIQQTFIEQPLCAMHHA